MTTGERSVWAAEFVRALAAMSSAGRERVAASSASKAVEAMRLASNAVDVPDTDADHMLRDMAGVDP